MPISMNNNKTWIASFKRNRITLFGAGVLGAITIALAICRGFPEYNETIPLNWRALIYILIYSLMGSAAFTFNYTISRFGRRKKAYEETPSLKESTSGQPNAGGNIDIPSYTFLMFLKEVDLLHLWLKIPYAVFLAFGIYVLSMAFSNQKIDFHIFIAISFICGFYPTKGALLLSRIADSITTFFGAKVGEEKVSKPER